MRKFILMVVLLFLLIFISRRSRRLLYSFYYFRKQFSSFIRNRLRTIINQMIGDVNG
ncbi:hypothetical protein ACLIA0_06755 [Bacillaceae bacterium W0354]